MIYQRKRGLNTLSCIGYYLIAETIDSNTEAVTSFQDGNDWHVCRVGLITSTIAYTVLRHSSSFFTENEIQLIQTIGVPISLLESIDIPEEIEVRSWNVAQLKEFLFSKNCAVTGTKSTPQERILHANLTPPIPSLSLEETLLKSWFMVPFSNSSMKLGSINEKNILKALPQFLESNSFLVIGEIAQRGLLRKKYSQPHTTQSRHATSIDGAVVLRHMSEVESVPIVTALECKTLTTSNSLREGEERLRE
jgi:hypothetical protein